MHSPTGYCPNICLPRVSYAPRHSRSGAGWIGLATLLLYRNEPAHSAVLPERYSAADRARCHGRCERSSCGKPRRRVNQFALSGDAEHAYFIAANQHVNELVCCWSDNDISAVAGGPDPISTSPLTSYVDKYGEHIVYLGANQHVYLLFYSYSTSRWSLTDLTAITSGALAATNTALTSFADPYGEYISYSGTNQHIYWMCLTFGGSPWHNQDITAAAGGALAASGSALTSFADGYGEHIFYIGANQHTYELIVTSSWAEKDLTTLTGASPAVAGSGLTSFSDTANAYYGPGGEHLFYVSSGTNGLQVNELLFNGSAWTSRPNLPGNQPPAAGSLALASLPGYDHNSEVDF